MERAWGFLFVSVFLAGATLFGAAYGQTPSSSRDPRAVETAIELAWLADPITFPYDLRAFVKDGVVEIHGTVPRADIRKQALNIARFAGGWPILDLTDIIPGVERSFASMPSEKVVVAIQAGIAKGLPQLANRVQAACDAEGRVTLTGSATTLAEKMALRNFVQRVPGCLLVQNRVQIGVVSAEGPMIQQVRANLPTAAILPPTDLAPPMISNQRTEEMRRALIRLCPGARGIAVFQTGAASIYVQFTARNEDDANQLAAFIFYIPSWRGLHIDIDARVPR